MEEKKAEPSKWKVEAERRRENGVQKGGWKRRERRWKGERVNTDGVGKECRERRRMKKLEKEKRGEKGGWDE